MKHFGGLAGRAVVEMKDLWSLTRRLLVGNSWRLTTVMKSMAIGYSCIDGSLQEADDKGDLQEADDEGDGIPLDDGQEASS